MHLGDQVLGDGDGEGRFLVTVDDGGHLARLAQLGGQARAVPFAFLGDHYQRLGHDVRSRCFPAQTKREHPPAAEVFGVRLLEEVYYSSAARMWQEGASKFCRRDGASHLQTIRGHEEKEDRMSRQRTYTGRSGQMAVVAELLFQQCNAAVPEVDYGTDVFAFQDEREEAARPSRSRPARPNGTGGATGTAPSSASR